MNNLTNAEFILATHGPLREGERYWITHFSDHPLNANGKAWGGYAATNIPDTPDQNAYVSTAILRQTQGAYKKRKANFSRMTFVVLDDAGADDCSYCLETSEGNFQTGFILADPIVDESIATRLQGEFGRQKLIVDADKSGYSAVRYVRMPVASNTKHSPAFKCNMREWYPDVRYKLAELADRFRLNLDFILTGAKSSSILKNSSRPDVIEAADIEDDPDKQTDEELITLVCSLEAIHDPLLKLSGRYIRRGMSAPDARKTLRGILMAHSDGSQRCEGALRDLDRAIVGAVEKGYSSSYKWPEIVDTFADHIAPPFPLDALPAAFKTLCIELAAGSGFDAGGYAFSLLISTSSLIDHRAKLHAGNMTTPAFLWGGLVARSGGGKSPTMKASLKGIRAMDVELTRESSRRVGMWLQGIELAGKKAPPPPPRPPWRQFIASDTTVEALGVLLQDNPEGILMVYDELSEFIGRMDAYSAGGGKDRGVYLSAYDGGQVTINRKSTPVPMVIENFSVGIIAGVQPEKLSELFKQRGGGADGLYQRFLMYAARAAGKVDYSAAHVCDTQRAVNDLQNRVKNELFGGDVFLSDEAKSLMQAYHQNARVLAQRTPAPRLAEHLDKFPGFLARVTFTLHALQCAVGDTWRDVVDADTLRRAEKIMKVLYHHSVAIYETLDGQAGGVSKLVKSACDAILSQGWQQIQRGDLTRYATGWQGAKDREDEGALDVLIECGWLHDITPAVQPGKRGRRSAGLFAVNPEAHRRFTDHAARIKTMRAERFDAVQALTAREVIS